MTGTTLQVSVKSEAPQCQRAQVLPPSVISQMIRDSRGPCRPAHPARHASTPLPVRRCSSWLPATDSGTLSVSRGVSEGEGSVPGLPKGPFLQEGEGTVRSSTGQETSRTVDFNSIYHTYRRRVYALCLRMVGNRTDAEDLTQDVFLRLFRKIVSFRCDSAFATWLHRLAVNVVLVRLRRKSLAECPLDSDTFQGQPSLPQELLGALDTTLIGAIDRLTGACCG
jgi:hypothetical protein